MLTFLHLSDIHFDLFEGNRDHDLEQRVRELMLEDIRTLHDEEGDMNAVLVVGDIASQGQWGEFLEAYQFLDRVCELIGCETDRVVCVPGNHDVDRSEHDAVHEAIREQLRSLPPEQVSDRLHKFLHEERGADALLAPLATYNRFAIRYTCDIGKGKLTWRPKSFDLGPRKVIVYGVTSAWICDALDSDKRDETKVVGGAFQCGQIASSPDDVAVAMMHHPSNWLRDAAALEPWTNRAHIMLTGHEHRNGITPDAARQRVAIASGAVNPSRTESGWIPAYNIIQMELGGAELDELRVKLRVRRWTEDAAGFGPDSRFEDPYELVIRVGRRVASEREESEEIAPPSPSLPPEPIDSDKRVAIFRVMRASPDLRHRAARELRLIGDTEVGGLALDRAILDAALSAGRLGELDERIAND